MDFITHLPTSSSYNAILVTYLTSEWRTQASGAPNQIFRIQIHLFSPQRLYTKKIIPQIA
jgi:hypothetical protein